MIRGMFIQAPCGSGKSTWIQSLNQKEREQWLDGDDILAREGIKNKNYFWYCPEKTISEREKIRITFEKYLKQGYNILYSGHPDLLPTDRLIIPETNQRWQWLQERRKAGGWSPSYEQFMNEEGVYRRASKYYPTSNSFNSLLA